jgi:hypothetical protein
MTISSSGSLKQSDQTVQAQTELSKSDADHRIFLSGGTIVACFIFIGLIVTVSLFQRPPSQSLPPEPSKPSANANAQEQIKILEVQERIYQARLTLLKEANTGNSETLRWLTTSTFPMFSAWIGTVLTFYFASGASRAENEGYQKLLEDANQRISGTGPSPYDKLKQLKLSSQVKGLTFFENDETLPLQTIKGKIEAASPRKKLLILKPDGSFKDIVTLSDISSFLVDPTLTSGSETGAGSVSAVSLAEYLQNRPLESKQPVVYAAPAESVYDAYTKMLNQKINNLIVTETGDTSAKVVAFLTNTEIEELMR